MTRNAQFVSKIKYNRVQFKYFDPFLLITTLHSQLVWRPTEYAYRSPLSLSSERRSIHAMVKRGTFALSIPLRKERRKSQRRRRQKRKQRALTLAVEVCDTCRFLFRARELLRFLRGRNDNSDLSPIASQFAEGRDRASAFFHSIRGVNTLTGVSAMQIGLYTRR